MKNPSILRNLGSRLTTLLFTTMIAAGGIASAQTTDIEQLAGTWRVQITQINCLTKAPVAPPFVSMLAFAGGGTMSGTTQNPTFAPGQRTSDYGIWKRTGRSTFSASSEAYILFPAGPLVRGTQRISQAISVDNDSFISVATVQFFDVTNTPVLTGCALASATRFK